MYILVLIIYINFRKIAKTNYNEHSSRSHAIVIITLFVDSIKGGGKKAA